MDEMIHCMECIELGRFVGNIAASILKTGLHIHGLSPCCPVGVLGRPLPAECPALDGPDADGRHLDPS